MQLRPTRAPAWFTRTLSLRRNARLKPKSTTQTATGIQCGAGGAEVDGHDWWLVQHARVLPRRLGPRSAHGSGGLPGLPAWALLSGSALAWLLALASQAAGLLAERWFFFAQARNPQNIYYQSVS